FPSTAPVRQLRRQQQMQTPAATPVSAFRTASRDASRTLHERNSRCVHGKIYAQKYKALYTRRLAPPRTRLARIEVEGEPQPFMASTQLQSPYHMATSISTHRNNSTTTSDR